MKWMIYGANGYTARLIAAEVVRRGFPAPVLAGRSRHKFADLAEQHGWITREFGLDEPDITAQQLQDIDLLLHCAGPFSATSAPMIEACLAAQTHYLDITGEIAVFEHAHAQHARAQQAGIVICPGVGFDVIPTDCVAAALKQALPDASHLALGYDSAVALSPGTTKTTLEGIALGGKLRRDGRIVTVPLACKQRSIDMGDGEKPCMLIAWGDVSTAFYSTGIGNIEVYVPGTPGLIRGVRRLNYLRWLFRIGVLMRAMQWLVARRVQGPDAAVRARTPTSVWGEVRNAAGECREARIKVANGYDVTVHGALYVVEHLLGQAVAGGAYTPSMLLGAQLIERLPGSGRIELR